MTSIHHRSGNNSYYLSSLADRCFFAYEISQLYKYFPYVGSKLRVVSPKFHISLPEEPRMVFIDLQSDTT